MKLTTLPIEVAIAEVYILRYGFLSRKVWALRCCKCCKTILQRLQQDTSSLSHHVTRASLANEAAFPSLFLPVGSAPQLGLAA